MGVRALAEKAVRHGLRIPDSAEVPGARVLEIPRRGSTLVTDLPGPPGAPTLVLLHSLGCTAHLTWLAALPALRQQYRVVTFDQRWHGQGFRGGRRFRLDDCADDAAAVADALAIPTFIPVGYSMGGLIAQLLWQRHRQRVAGLVLAATVRNFRGTHPERAFFAGLPPVLVPLMLRSPPSAPDLDGPAGGDEGPGPRALDTEILRWMWRELRTTRPGAMSQALADIGRFNSAPWIGGVDVPTAVVITTRDRFLPTRRQRKLAESIPGATTHEIAANHGACIVGAQRFVPVLADACSSVVSRLPATARKRPRARP
jgi:pimeloyl-ACP methyl ester carboxylesterase